MHFRSGRCSQGSGSHSARDGRETQENSLLRTMSLSHVESSVDQDVFCGYNSTLCLRGQDWRVEEQWREEENMEKNRAGTAQPQVHYTCYLPERPTPTTSRNQPFTCVTSKVITRMSQPSHRDEGTTQFRQRLTGQGHWRPELVPSGGWRRNPTAGPGTNALGLTMRLP